MADGFLNRFFGYGTAAEVAAEPAPSEPTVALGLAQLYLRYETDTGVLSIWNGSTWDDYDLDALAGAGAITSSGLTMTTARILGRTTASTGAIEELTVGAGLLLSGGALTASANLQTFSGITPSANVQTFLAAADYAAMLSLLGGSTSGPITTSGHTMATDRLLGRTTASTGAIEEVTVGSGLTFSATTLSVNFAASSDLNTGTDATKAITSDALAGSNFGIRYIALGLNGTTALTTSDKAYFRIPAAYNGMNLVTVGASVGTGAAGSSSSGTPTFTVKNVTDNNQMLSTSLTVDANEYSSATAATPAVIDTSFDDVVTDDLIEVACTVAGTGVTYATITLGFQLP